jgi:hypothetical protein
VPVSQAYVWAEHLPPQQVTVRTGPGYDHRFMASDAYDPQLLIQPMTAWLDRFFPTG